MNKKFYSVAFSLTLSVNAIAGGGPNFPKTGTLVGEKNVLFTNNSRETVEIFIDSCSSSRDYGPIELMMFPLAYPIRKLSSYDLLCYDDFNVPKLLGKNVFVLGRDPGKDRQFWSGDIGEFRPYSSKPQGQKSILIGPGAQETVFFQSYYGLIGAKVDQWSFISFSKSMSVCSSQDVPKRVGKWDNPKSAMSRSNYKYGWISPSAWMGTVTEKNKVGVKEINIEENPDNGCIYFSPHR